jgi:hypothetical protein
MPPVIITPQRSAASEYPIESPTVGTVTEQIEVKVSAEAVPAERKKSIGMFRQYSLVSPGVKRSPTVTMRM